MAKSWDSRGSAIELGETALEETDLGETVLGEWGVFIQVYDNPLGYYYNHLKSEVLTPPMDLQSD